MKSQTDLFAGVTRPDRELGILTLLILVLLLLAGAPTKGLAQESDGRGITSRKAVRAYPVSYHRSGLLNRPQARRAAPVPKKMFRGIPRAKVVKRALVEKYRRATASKFDSRAEVPATLASKKAVVEAPHGGQDRSPTPQRQTSQGFPASPSTASLVRRCDVMALEGLKYVFGAEDPTSGGLDCSGAVQYLLSQEGIRDVPRTAYTQYQWLKKLGTLNKISRFSWSKDRAAAKLRPGDLMFWTGTYDTGKSPNISHVMIYLGRDANNGKRYMFGASSRRSKGLHGNAVDVYEFVYPRKHGRDNFAGFGSVPGVRR